MFICAPPSFFGPLCPVQHSARLTGDKPITQVTYFGPISPARQTGCVQECGGKKMMQCLLLTPLSLDDRSKKAEIDMLSLTDDLTSLKCAESVD